jgi:hypothetical protein
MMEQPTSSAGFDPNVLVQRVRRLAMLDATVFDEVRGDSAATIGSAIVAVVSMFLYGVGGWLWYLFSDYDYKSGEFFWKSAIVGTVLSLLLWAVAVAVTYVMLTQVFRGQADIQQLFRVMGYALAPLALGLLAFIPEISFGVALAAAMLTFGASVIAAQAATDAPAGKALAAVGAGFLVWAVILTLFVGDDPYGPGVFVIFEV